MRWLLGWSMVTKNLFRIFYNYDNYDNDNFYDIENNLRDLSSGEYFTFFCTFTFCEKNCKTPNLSQAALLTVSTLVTIIKTGILRAIAKPRCSRVVAVQPLRALITIAAKWGR